MRETNEPRFGVAVHWDYTKNEATMLERGQFLAMVSEQSPNPIKLARALDHLLDRVAAATRGITV